MGINGTPYRATFADLCRLVNAHSQVVLLRRTHTPLDSRSTVAIKHGYTTGSVEGRVWCQTIYVFHWLPASSGRQAVEYRVVFNPWGNLANLLKCIRKIMRNNRPFCGTNCAVQ
jgi:hypothetical protein